MAAMAPLIIPAEILKSIGKDDDAVRLELAIFFYKEFDLSAEEVATFAGIPRVAFFKELRNRQIQGNYDKEGTPREVNTMKNSTVAEKSGLEKQIKIVKKGQDEGNLLYWLSLTEKDRMIELEKMRQEINKWKYGTRQELQRVYRIVKRA